MDSRIFDRFFACLSTLFNIGVDDCVFIKFTLCHCNLQCGKNRGLYGKCYLFLKKMSNLIVLFTNYNKKVLPLQRSKR